MTNNKNSRKNNKQQAQAQAKAPVATTTTTTTTTTNDDDDWGLGSILSKTGSRNNTRSNKKKKETEAEPAPVVIPDPIPEWEQVGMTKEDYTAMCERTSREMTTWQTENYKNSLIAELDSISFWENRIETLEQSRERYNTKRGWTAEDIDAVEDIDAEIKECETEIARIEEENSFEEDISVY